MRGLNIASALHRRDPAIEIGLLTRGAPPDGMVDARVVGSVRGAATAEEWSRAVEAFGPSLTVWDTLLPEQPPAAGSGRRHVFVMRGCRSERQAELLARGDLRRFDRILVPHAETELGCRLPADLVARTRFVGPIVRTPRPELHEPLRRRYRLKPGDFVLVSTPGGGGFQKHACDFLEAVRMAQEQLVLHIPRLRHVVVAGPRYRGPALDVAGCVFAGAEPELVTLLGLASCVVAAGGYNTVHEIRANGVPAVFLPGERTHDDQAERVARLVQAGLAVVASGSPERCSQTIVSTCLDAASLDRMRRRHRELPLEPGNDAAADELLELLPC
jgi:hypothetical protein